MATMKVPVLIQSCKSCGRKLLKGTTQGGNIGSPLITCKHCGTEQFTPLRVEWYQYQARHLVWIWPILLSLGMFVSGTFMEDAETGALAAIFGFFLGLCFSGKMIVQMICSKKRMGDLNYLNKLLQYGVITLEEYVRFREKTE